MTLDEIVDTFELLGDWEQRYQYLVELGEHMPAMPDKYRTDDNKVHGCVSDVWIHAYQVNDKIRFYGDSNTSIIKGILALLIQLCTDKSAGQIAHMDMEEIFHRLNLAENLSPNRHLGVYAMFDLIKQKARIAGKTTQAA